MPDNQDPGTGTEELTLEQAQEQITTLTTQLNEAKDALTAANNESAGRRHKLKELQDQIDALTKGQQTEEEQANADLVSARAQVADQRSRLRKYEMRDAFVTAARKAEVKWANEQAIQDAFELAYGQMPEAWGVDETPTPKEMKELLEGVLKGRDYLLTPEKKPPEDDLNKRSSGAPTLTREQLEQSKRGDIDYQKF